MAAAKTLQPAPKTLPEVWSDLSLTAPRRIAILMLFAGDAGIASMAFGLVPLTALLVLLIVGAFGARSLVLRRFGRRQRAARAVFDWAAAFAAVLLALRLLQSLLGGTVGMIRA